MNTIEAGVSYRALETGMSLHVRGSNSEELPEQVDCEYEFLRLANGVELTSAILRTETPSQWASTSSAGISLGVVLQGSVEFGVGRRSRLRFSEHSGFLLANSEKVESAHAIATPENHHTVYVHLSESALDELGLRSFNANGARNDTRLRRWTPQGIVLILARQIASCPYTGPIRQLYLEAKALELLAVAYSGATGDDTWNGKSDVVSASDRERLVAARDILVAEFSSPPSLDELSRRVGMCTSKLTAGFRHTFAMSVTDFVQEQRLQTAFAMLSEGRLSVSQVAYAVGYTPAHFSTVFRRKFGVSPTAVIVRRR